MTTINVKNRKVVDALKVYLLSEKGYTEDKYGNCINVEKTMKFHFNAISYRIEQKLSNGRWYKIGGHYYKDVSMVNGVIIRR